MKYTLPQLPYANDALEPFIDAKTMEIHHAKHHQAYIDKLNAVLDKHPDLIDTPLEQLLSKLETLSIPDADKKAIRNHGGGHLNHSLFWTIMGPTKEVDLQLTTEIQETFGSLEDFKKQFTDQTAAIFGSGWMWLVRNSDGKLEIYSTPNQDSPLMKGDEPIIGLDVWEHAYYLKYQNRRPEYIQAWWSVLKLLP
ncbi:MAG: superoxide dismutase [Patescibacteria group bacterium]